ncbi:hypothetical protein Taro_001026 [Colocasia esculenta]|uniref:Uncharacterized protein n=1 Tax=Colocasia esculenta TaxID=4460 RepID=A0A843TEQ1_COLES|nr:hypothetical protein [Colocasia esculenta]
MQEQGKNKVCGKGTYGGREVVFIDLITLTCRRHVGCPSVMCRPVGARTSEYDTGVTVPADSSD